MKNQPLTSGKSKTNKKSAGDKTTKRRGNQDIQVGVSLEKTRGKRNNLKRKTGGLRLILMADGRRSSDKVVMGLKQESIQSTDWATLSGEAPIHTSRRKALLTQSSWMKLTTKKVIRMRARLIFFKIAKIQKASTASVAPISQGMTTDGSSLCIRLSHLLQLPMTSIIHDQVILTTNPKQ